MVIEATYANVLRPSDADGKDACASPRSRTGEGQRVKWSMN
jgi:hypothetical protein